MVISKELTNEMYKAVINLLNPNGCFSTALQMPTWAWCCEANMPELMQEYLFIKSTFSFMDKHGMPHSIEYDEYLKKIEPYVLEYLAK